MRLQGLSVLLSDRKQDIVQQGLGQIQRLMEKQIKKGLLTQDDAHAAMGRISPSVSLEVRTVVQDDMYVKIRVAGACSLAVLTQAP